MTSRDLVPQGLPHGERQKIEAARRQAGLANETAPQAPPSQQVSSPVRRPPRAPRASAFDALQNRTPTLPGLTGVVGTGVEQTPLDSFKQRAMQSPNPVLRSIAEILPEYQ